MASGSGDAISPGSHRTGEGLRGTGRCSTCEFGATGALTAQPQRGGCPLLPLLLWFWVLGGLRPFCSAPPLPQLLGWPAATIGLWLQRGGPAVGELKPLMAGCPLHLLSAWSSCGGILGTGCWLGKEALTAEKSRGRAGSGRLQWG